MRGRHLLPLLTLAFVAAVQLWFVTYGTWDLKGDRPEVWGEAFDYLARSLSRGRVDVPPASIGFEGIEVGGNTYLYFGPFPALIRILPDILWPDSFGHWSRISCYLAASLSMIAVYLGVSVVLARKKEIRGSQQIFLECVTILGFGIGSPLLFLSSDSMIFIEPILWGLCFSLWSIVAIFHWFDRPERFSRLIMAVGTLATLALLARLTFAIPLYGVLAYLIFSDARRSPGITHALWLSLISLPALVGVGAQLLYNWARFQSPFVTRSWQMAHSGFALFGAEFNLFAIPISFFNYFAARPGAISFDPPYIHSLPIAWALPGLFLEWTERVIPLTIGSPWLVFTAAIGCYGVLRLPLPAVLRALAVALLLQTLLILSWHFITQRYLGDLLPLLFFLTLLALRNSPHGRFMRTWPFVILLLFSLVATPLSTIDFHLATVGDTGMQKTNRPLLYSLFYDSVDHLNTGTPVVIRSNLPECHPLQGATLRGDQYQDLFSFSGECRMLLTLDQPASSIEFIVALSDHFHGCEIGDASLVVESPDGIPMKITRITQRSAPRPVRLETNGMAGLVFYFKGLAKECVRGFIIQPVANLTREVPAVPAESPHS